MRKFSQYFVIALLVLAQNAYSQSNEAFKGSFKEVIGVGKVKIKLVADAENFAQIIGSEEESSNVKISFSNNAIKIQALQFWKGDYINVEVHYTSLTAINMDAGAQAYTASRLTSKNLEISASAGSDVNADLECDNLNLKSGQGSNIEFTGTADNLNASANTGAIIDGRKAVAESCTLTSNTGAEITIKTCESMQAKVNTGGIVYYTAKPNDISIKSNTGGEVKLLKK